MILTNKWETALGLDEHGANIIINRRIDIENFRATGKLPYRVEVIYSYHADATGMPLGTDERLIAQMEEALKAVIEKDKLGILTGSYLGGGNKYLAFYCRNVEVFFERLNAALDEMPDLPLSFEAEEDPSWEEYQAMADFEALRDISAE